MTVFSDLITTCCGSRCKSQWCCSIEKFAPPPLSADDIAAIQKRTHSSDFFIQDSTHSVLKTASSGYCIFFDPTLKQCRIYDIRPLDCRLFPFVCFGPGEKKVWIVWECLLSNSLNETDIENILYRFEHQFGNDLNPICEYDPDGYDLSCQTVHPKGYRIIRDIRR